MDCVDAELVAAQILGQHLAQLFVVVDQENVFHRLPATSYQL
jgi:hypothetical protein